MWYAVVDKKTKELFSVGTVIANPLPVQFKAIELGNDFNMLGKMWDKVTETFVTDNTIETIADNILSVQGVSKLSIGEKSALRDKLIVYLGGK